MKALPKKYKMRYILILVLLSSEVQAQPFHDYTSLPTISEQYEQEKQLCSDSEHDLAIDYLNLEQKYSKACKGQDCIELVRELHKDLQDNFERGASSYYSKFCMPQGE